jgi:hypothetical protein
MGAGDPIGPRPGTSSPIAKEKTMKADTQRAFPALRAVSVVRPGRGSGNRRVALAGSPVVNADRTDRFPTAGVAVTIPAPLPRRYYSRQAAGERLMVSQLGHLLPV